MMMGMAIKGKRVVVLNAGDLLALKEDAVCATAVDTVSVGRRIGKMKIKLVIPCVPLSLNRLYSMHWSKRHRLLQEWIDEVWIALKKDEIRIDKPFKRARVRVRYYFRDRKRRDKENYAPKMIVDALRYNGIIEDDSIKHIDLDWEILQGKFARTEIEVQEIETK